MAEQNKQPTSWREVYITPDMPLGAVINFFNILNQRLCDIEDNTKIVGPEGKVISVTEAIRLQAEEEIKRQQQEHSPEAAQGE